MEKNRFLDDIPNILEDIQQALYNRALTFREGYSSRIDDKDEFYRYFTPKNADKPEIHGGFASSPWCGESGCEEKIKEDLSVTIRCIPFESEEVTGTCIGCGKAAKKRVVFAKAY